ncbi:hypothetical protein [Peribacillus sp. SCS-155]
MGRKSKLAALKGQEESRVKEFMFTFILNICFFSFVAALILIFIT